MKQELNTLKRELFNLQMNNPKLSAHYSPVYDKESGKWYVIMHNPGETKGNDWDDAKQEEVAYKKSIFWMKKEIYLHELKHPIH